MLSAYGRKIGSRNMTSSTERRTRSDRRSRDAGPPKGCNERRLRAERRLPEIQESTISDSDWDSLFGGILLSPNTDSPRQDTAAEILDRAADGD